MCVVQKKTLVECISCEVLQRWKKFQNTGIAARESGKMAQIKFQEKTGLQCKNQIEANDT